MKQQTLAMAAKNETGFEQRRKPTRRDEFLDMMNRIVPLDMRGLFSVAQIQKTNNPFPSHKGVGY